jgi:hypothetical protein
MNRFGPEAYFVHIPSRFSPDNAAGVGFMAMAANFAEGSHLQSGGCGCSHCNNYNQCAMGGLLHPTGATYGMNLQKIRFCGPKLNISCESEARATLEEEVAWVPPTLEDFERAVGLGHPAPPELAELLQEPELQPESRRASSGNSGAPEQQQQQQQQPQQAAVGIDVDSNWPHSAPTLAAFADCLGDSASSSSTSKCASSLLSGWANTSCSAAASGGGGGNANDAALPEKPDKWTAMLWKQLVGDATFDTVLQFFLPPPPNSTAGWLPTAPPPCHLPALYLRREGGSADAAAAEVGGAGCGCVRALAFRDKTHTSVILVLLNLHANATFQDNGETGRALHYIHRKEWQLTAPSLTSDAVSLNGVALSAGQQAPLPHREPLAEATDGGKAALRLPPLSLTFMQLGLIPGDGVATST